MRAIGITKSIEEKHNIPDQSKLYDAMQVLQPNNMPYHQPASVIIWEFYIIEMRTRPI